MGYRLKIVLLLLTWVVLCNDVCAHGLAGDRYFPATITVDDAFAANEGAITVGRTPNVGAGNYNTNAGNVAMITAGVEPIDGVGINVSGVYRNPNANIEPERNGFDDVYYTFKNELSINDKHEFAITAGLTGQLGGTGTHGTYSYSTYTPTIFYAKGFGDLPDSLGWLKPAAITGILGYQISHDQSQSNIFNWGFTLQYSLLYLNDHVAKDSLAKPFNHLIAIVECPFQTSVSGPLNGQVTGSINPGVVWAGEEYSVALEGVFPANAWSGKSNGILVQLHRYF